MIPRTMRSAALVPLLLAAACTERVLAPAAPAPEPVAALECRADVHGAVLECAAPPPAAGSGPSLAILGGQDRNVRLSSANAGYDSASGVFGVDVTVQNLMAQAMGAAEDGGIAGVEVFFSTLPAATRGTGPVVVRNADGEGVFTSAAQPFFRYPERLEPGATSQPKRWEWAVPPSVEGFSFTVYVSAPLSAPDGSAGLAFRSLSAAGENACGVTLDGEGYCWGSSGFGQLGAGPDVVWQGVIYRPVRVLNGPWDTLTVADMGTCGLKRGQAWCWGTDLDGGLGTGGVSSGCGGTSDQNSGCSFEPVPAAEGFTFRRLAAGGSLRRPYLPYNRVTCGLDADGKAWCWGSDAYGTRGDGIGPGGLPVPRAVAGGHTFTSVSVGYHHSCAIDTDGAAWCWGYEIAGELGHAQTQGDIAYQPEAVQGGLRFRQVDAGGVHTCGVTVDGEVWCWGYNYRGQLGTDQVLGTCSNGFECGEVPVRAASDETFVQVTTGQVHTCALTAEGAVYCWGLGYLAGRGPNPDNAVNCDGSSCYRTPVPVLSSERFVQVEAGREFTCAIARGSRKVFCWGDYRTVGQGLGQPVYVPTRIVEPAD